ncbi:MAG: hypothetical protein HF975_05200 [ANME-2 cluster archaeon]|nr:hypothetical protein [ANME-2 cluster archaeon]MBC2746396.1 hypothetical protein [ANME-2 cluster archaeon]
MNIAKKYRTRIPANINIEYFAGDNPSAILVTIVTNMEVIVANVFGVLMDTRL